MKLFSRLKQAFTPKPKLPLQEKQIQIEQTMRRTKSGQVVPVEAHQKLMMVRPEDIPQPKLLPKGDDDDKQRQKQPAIPVPEKKRVPTERPADTGKPIVPDRGVRAGRYAEQGIQIGREALNQDPQEDHISTAVPRLVDRTKKYSLMPHQADAVNLAIEKFQSGSKGFLLADGTGGGKTMTQLAYAAVQASKGESSLIVTQDARIINGFIDDGKKLDIEVNNQADATPTAGKIHITTYDRLDKLGAVNFDNVIFDESHNLKNVYAGKSMQGRELIRQSGKIMLASATPMDKPEHVRYIADAFGLDHADVLEDLGYQRSSEAWERTENARETAYRIGAFYDGLTELGLMTKREVSMRNVGFKSRELKLLPQQHATYDQMIKDMQTAVGHADKHGKNPGMVKSKHLMRIRRYLEDIKTDHAIEAAVQSVQQGRQPVIFATRISDMEISPGQVSRSTVQRLEEELTKRGIPVVALHGAATGDPSQKIDDFNSGKAKVFITTYQSGGTGINLDDTVGDCLRDQIHMTPPFSATAFIQASGRTNRVTTKSKTRILSLTTDTGIDQWNKAIVESKLKTVGAAVGGDYQQLSIEDIEAASNMGDDDAYHFIVGSKGASPDIKIPQNSHRTMGSIVDLRKQLRSKKPMTAAKPEVRVRPKSEMLAVWSELRPHIPRMPGGTMPNFTVSFGKFKGKKLSDIDREDLQDVLSYVSGEDVGARYVKMLKFDDPKKFMKSYRSLSLWLRTPG